MPSTPIRFQTCNFTAALLVAAGCVASVPAAASAQLSGSSGSDLVNSAGDSAAILPQTLTLTGVVRDFRDRAASGGHPDFQRQPTRGFAHYAYQVKSDLDDDGKPAFNNTGRKVTAQWKDSSGRNIMPPREHVASRESDARGAAETVEGGSLTNAASFAQWWRDDGTVNASMPLPITMVRTPGTNVYTFNDRSDPTYSNLGGFFPINGQLFGDYSSTGKNFHFTYELDTTFKYQRGSGQVFSFTGDDDVYVFIDGKCVIDLGGVHSAVSQTIELDRCTWLETGRRYSLKFFFAERHTTQSNFRIDTTLTLENAELPATSALFD